MTARERVAELDAQIQKWRGEGTSVDDTRRKAMELLEADPSLAAAVREVFVGHLVHNSLVFKQRRLPRPAPASFALHE